MAGDELAAIGNDGGVIIATHPSFPDIRQDRPGAGDKDGVVVTGPVDGEAAIRGGQHAAGIHRQGATVATHVQTTGIHQRAVGEHHAVAGPVDSQVRDVGDDGAVNCRHVAGGRAVADGEVLVAGIPRRATENRQRVVRRTIADDAGGCRIGNSLVAENDGVAAHAGRAEVQAGNCRRQVAVGQVQRVAGIVEADAANVCELTAGDVVELVVRGHTGAGRAANRERAAAEVPKARVLDADDIVGRAIADGQANAVHGGVGDGHRVTTATGGANGNHPVVGEGDRAGGADNIQAVVAGVAAAAHRDRATAEVSGAVGDGHIVANRIAAAVTVAADCQRAGIAPDRAGTGHDDLVKVVVRPITDIDGATAEHVRAIADDDRRIHIIGVPAVVAGLATNNNRTAAIPDRTGVSHHHHAIGAPATVHITTVNQHAGVIDAATVGNRQ